LGLCLAIELNLKRLCKLGFLIPLGAFVLCILITLIKDFREANETHCQRLKMSIFIFYLISIIGSLYFYTRHNEFCEPYVYSLFSLCEYLTVLANIAYHMVIFYDFNLFDNRFKLTFLHFNKIK
jgi:hypothetical protein